MQKQEKGQDPSLEEAPDAMVSEGGLHEPVEDGDACARCGMEKADWGSAQGIQKEGETFCCQGCADETGCLCEEQKARGAGQEEQTLSAGIEKSKEEPSPAKSGRRHGQATKGKPQKEAPQKHKAPARHPVGRGRR